MTRVTRTLPKLTNGVAFRSISSSASTSRPSMLLNSSNESTYLPRKLSELKLECQKRQLKSSGSKAELVHRLNAHDMTRSHSTISVSNALHRPSANSPNQSVFRPRPLMQAFNHSAPKQAALDNSSIDHFFLPSMAAEQASNPFTIRVPILPDNTTPQPTARVPETLDMAIPHPEISIISAHPETNVVAAMTEVVGNAGMEENIEVLSRAAEFKPGKSGGNASSKETNTLQDLWNGVLDDVFGSKKGSPIMA